MAARTYETKILHAGESSMCAIEVPFDPKSVFGKVRAPVRVTVNGYTYRTTVSSMGGQVFVPLRREHREAAGVRAGDRVQVTMELDAEPRVVEPPKDLADALRAEPGAWETWERLSYTHQREWAEAVEEAKKPETRARRIEKAVEEMRKRGGESTRNGKG